MTSTYKIIGINKGKRKIRWIKKELIEYVNNIEKYRVFLPQANGTGKLGEKLSMPIVGTPMLGHTDTFLSIGSFNTEQEAVACQKYIKTKFARTMLGTMKVTQNTPSAVWSNVPLQDFTSTSDIDWSQSIADIDRQLYAKYGLSDDEIAFIEKMIKPME